MVLLNPLAFLCFTAVWSCMSSAVVERRFFCSSEKCNIWYTFEGPLYYLSLKISPCSIGVSKYNLTYALIPMFTIARIGYHAIVHYRGQLWLEHTQPDVPCEDYKICDIIKGESLIDTIPVHVTRFNGPEGEYQVYLTVTVIDDLQETVTLRFNITFDVKKLADDEVSQW